MLRLLAEGCLGADAAPALQFRETQYQNKLGEKKEFENKFASHRHKFSEACFQIILAVFRHIVFKPVLSSGQVRLIYYLIRVLLMYLPI